MVFSRKVNAAYLSLSLEVSYAVRVYCSFSFNISSAVSHSWMFLQRLKWCYNVCHNDLSFLWCFRLFERGLAYVGTDYLSYPLWDKFIEYEYSQQEWSRLAMIYTRILENPNQQLDRYLNRWISCFNNYIFAYLPLH